jgi:hypothetical protein
MKSGTFVLEYHWKFPIKLKVLLPFDPVIVFFGIYAKEQKIYKYTKTSIQMFIAVLF